MKGEERFLHVDGCPLCDYFTTDKINDVVVYNISKDFIVIKCESCGRPLVISRNHVFSSSDIGKTAWGWILKTCRQRFGGGMRILTSDKSDKKRLRDIHGCKLPEDHFCAHIETLDESI